MSTKTNADDNFWKSATEKQLNERDQQVRESQAPKSPKKSRKLKILGFTAAALLIVVGGVIALAPAIASSLAPGIIAGQSGTAINGTISVTNVSLGWGGPQRIEGLKIVDESKVEVVNVKSMEVSAGLLSLITGNLDLGTVAVNGVKANVVKRANGKTNLEYIQKAPSTPQPASSSSGLEIPSSLKAKISLKNISANYTDETATQADGKPLQVSLNNLDSNINFAAGQPLKIDAKGEAQQGEGGGVGGLGGLGKIGSINIVAEIDQWMNANGTLTPDIAKVDATVNVKNLPVALIDAFAPGIVKGSSLRNVLGDTVDVQAVANGGLTGGDADITATSPNTSLKAKVVVANSILTNQGPIQVTISGPGVAALAGPLQKSLEDQNAKIDAYPGATLSIDGVSFALPIGGKPMTFKGSGATIAANLTETRGTVVLQENATPQPFKIAPVTALIDAKDLGGTVRLSASTSAELSGQAAGNLSSQFTVAGLLNSKGEFAGGIPSDVKGDITIAGVATAIAQPFVQALKVNLPRDVGPTVDAHFKVATEALAAGTTSSGNTRPPMNVDVNITSQHLKVVGGVRYAADSIKLRDGEMRIEAKRAGPIVGGFLDPALGYALSPSRLDATGLTLVISQLDVPMLAGNKPDVKKMTATANIGLDGIAVVPVVDGVRKPPVDIQKMNIAAQVLAGGNLKAEMDSTIWHESKPFSAVGVIEIVGALASDKDGNPAMALDTMKPSGKVQLKDLPMTLARLAPSKPGPNGEPPLDLVALLQGVVGPTMTISLDAKPGDASSYDVIANVKSQRVTADVNARGSQKQIELRSATASADIAPETVSGLVQTFAPTLTGVPQLVSASKLQLSLDPLIVPITSTNSLDLASVGAATAKVTLPGRTLVRGLTAKNEDGTTRDLGQSGVEDFSINASFPVSGLVGPAPAGQRGVKAKLAGAILGGDDARVIALLDGDLSTEMSNKALAGPLAAKINLTQIDVTALERIIGKSGVVSGAIGNKAQLALNADIQPPSGTPGGQAYDLALGTMSVQAAIDAPKLKSDGPLKATITPDAVRLSQPSKFTMEADPAWINSMIKPAAQPGVAGRVQAPKASVTMQEISPIQISLDKLNLPRAVKGRAGTSSNLEAAMGISVARMQMLASDGQTLRVGATNLNIKSDAVGGSSTAVNFKVNVAEVTLGERDKAVGINITGVVNDLVDASGGINPSNATVSVRGDLPQIPTVLLDALSANDGTVVDALGPVAKAKFNIERYPLSGKPREGTTPPVIDVDAGSQRANAKVKGSIRSDGIFVSQEPFRANVLEVTQALSSRFIKGLPLMGTFVKTPQDQPATLEITNITASLQNDLSKLNADIVFDPGEARFGTSSAFGELLKVVEARTAGQVGKRLEPVTMKVRNGVATYDRWRVPLGEFTVETEGTVNLVNRTVDVVTYVPFAAVSDRAIGALNLGAGSALNKLIGGSTVDALTMVPIRTRGPMDQPSTNIDGEAFAKNLIKSVNPKDIIERGLGDLLKPKAPPTPSPSPLPAVPK